MMSMPLILVDENDCPISEGEKMDTHRRGVLHRAFSVFVFDTAGRFLLQKRAKTKYHSGGLWTNACCGHPHPGEKIDATAARRLREEMELTCSVQKMFSYIYSVRLDHGMTEHEYLHVFSATTDQDPHPDPAEADGWKWMSLDDLMKDVLAHPERYTKWLLLSLERMVTATERRTH